MIKDVKDTLLDRRSVRRYEREALAPEDLEFIREAIRNTPTSYNGQQFSVIEVSDQGIKDELAEIVGQKQLKTAALDLCFLSDYNKIRVAAEAKGLKYPPFQDTTDGLMVGVIDASLALMSAVAAANSRGLGCCPIGYARTVNPARVSELLELPDGVFLVCALSIGIPREIPDLKPKQPADLLFFRDKYGVAAMPEKLLAYDREIIKYHETRSENKSGEDWIGQILSYYKEGLTYDMLAALKARGYGMES
ncbi:MAG: nitroreductase family protein [Desulfovibrio sp.]|nr:nitroreductase family protein [Desulfovibrio sp.]